MYSFYSSRICIENSSKNWGSSHKPCQVGMQLAFTNPQLARNGENCVIKIVLHVIKLRLKSTFFKKFSSLRWPLRDRSIKKKSKNVDFSLRGKQCIVLPKWTFLRVLAHCVMMSWLNICTKTF